MAYLLTLTDDDVKTIDFSDWRWRHGWAGYLRVYGAGDNILTEREALAFQAAVDRDIIAGQRAYQGISPTSTLATKLHTLYQSII